VLPLQFKGTDSAETLGIKGDEKIDVIGLANGIRPQMDVTMVITRADGTREEGGVTLFQPSGEQLFIYDAAMKYVAQGTPTVVFGGEEYGTGSSRDWAAKGTQLLGVKAVIARSFERIHRSNLVGMGVLPLQFKGSDSVDALGVKGDETYDIEVPADIRPQQDLVLGITGKDGQRREVEVLCRIDTPIEVDYYRHGGILPFVLRELVA
jgi:aconitate hydratase